MATTIAYNEIKGWSDEELQHELTASKMKLTKLRFNHAITPLENTNVLGETKKHIARIQTELRKRQLSKQA
ncbi:MAG TPA: 50S ribosomal protein L29 [Chitinophagales bacterium]|jgi:large subunit ribosomal protein L29|nr:50S ribosomal protein L29 [Chitinophagales bacterium]HPW86308.1 50S ribosomal protein L29 [Chitinophagales bacterium]HQD12205.1 50S ribosomal protein L29 [Chitinophagales bacterium]HQO30810.1 50S ribosomal protein L29 [Chitinophagales bacterium]HQO88307.1 50S ribosomal protein L29 [Chitinophagales bacterium]